MRITIVCAHYLPRLGYIEVHLARAFSALGHPTSVVCSSAIPPYVKHLQPSISEGEEKDMDVQLFRIKPFLNIGQLTFANGVRKTVIRSKPDLIIVIGHGKYFPKAVYGLNTRIITLLGDNKHNYAHSSVFSKLKSRLLFSLFKRPMYELAIQKSYKLLAYTPESYEVAGTGLSPSFQKKLGAMDDFISLGFSADEFYYKPDWYATTRKELNIPEEAFLVVTATRVVAEKQLEAYIPAFGSLPKHYYWLVVGGNESAYSKTFEAQAKTALGDSRFKLMNHTNRERLNRILNSADAALYTVTAITVFEALGTGLPCILPPDKSLAHVLAQENLSAAFNPVKGMDLLSALQMFETVGPSSDQRENIRRNRAEIAKANFSWSSIAVKVIEQATLEK